MVDLQSWGNHPSPIVVPKDKEKAEALISYLIVDVRDR